MVVSLISGCWPDVEPTKGIDTQTAPTHPSNLDQVSQKLDKMQSQWQSHGLDNYRFQFQWACFCPAEYHEPVWVTVEEGEITSVKAVDPNFEAELPDKSEYRTINELFNFIKDGVEKDVYEIQVSYDEAMGYPVSAYIDYEIDILDEEQGFDILKFETQFSAPTESSQPATLNPRITISPTSGPPGTIVQVSAREFLPNIPVNIGIGRVNSEYDVITSTNTDKNGNLDTTIKIPVFATPQDQWVIVVAAVNQVEKAISRPFDVTP